MNTLCLIAPALWGCPGAGTRSLVPTPHSSECPLSPSPLRAAPGPLDPALTSSVLLPKAIPKGCSAPQA